MKGVVLASGNGTRLMPLTSVIPKSLLPVYDKPMIFYPIQTLIDSGIKDILIVCQDKNIEMFKQTVGNTFDVNIEYITREPNGTADALLVAKDFVGKDPFTVIYGDNIFEESFKKEVETFKIGAELFIVQVSDPEKYGVVEFEGNTIVGIEEKPKKPKSNYIDTGLIIFDNSYFDKVKNIKPHENGEYFIPDVLNLYIKEDKLKGRHVNSAWFDAGTFDSLLEAGDFMKDQCQ